MKNFPILPVLVGMAAGAVLVGFLSKSSAAPAPKPTPTPPPLPTPPLPLPTPPTPGPPNQQQQAVLLQQLQALMTQALLTPGAVDPQQLQTLSYQLDAAGLPAQAQQARDLAAQLRAQRGQTPVGV